MKVEKFVIGMIQTNCYLVQNEESKECFLVDPAICPEELVGHIKSEGLKLKAILLTHGHFDHIMGLDGFLKEFPVPVYAHEEEQGLLNDAVLNASAEYGPGYTFSDAEYLKDGQKLTAAGMEIEVLPASRLHLEITESAYTENPKQIIDTVSRLRDMGFD